MTDQAPHEIEGSDDQPGPRPDSSCSPEDAATEESPTEEVAAEDDATEDDAAEDEATEDDATQDGATQDDATQDGATQDDATQDDAIEGSTNGAEAAEESAAAEAAEADEPASLEEQLEAAKRESADTHDRYLRARAELENVVRRHERELGERVRYGPEALAKDMLSVVDGLERALEHRDASDEGFADGVELVLKSLRGVLESHGVTRIEACGEPFDPSRHEAVAMTETDEAEPNTVIAEHRAGYALHDRLLRAAMVVVAKAPAAAADPGDGENPQ